jgi:CxxC-x17-CxxC domain-containing protein
MCGILDPGCRVQVLLREDELRYYYERFDYSNVARYRKKLVNPHCGRKEKRNSLTDQTLYCRDCNREFTFTTGEQEFYASRGLTNAPTRCPECRAARKQAGGGRSGGQRGEYRGGGGGGEYRDRGEYRERDARPMYTATCASCGNEATVPFQPRDDRPVYCSNCYQPQPRRSQYSGSNSGRSRW